MIRGVAGPGGRGLVGDTLSPAAVAGYLMPIAGAEAPATLGGGKSVDYRDYGRGRETAARHSLVL
jgi:hypothetical protein